MSESRSDRYLSVLLSVLIHAAIIGALVWGWFQYRAPKPQPQVLAIEATIVHGTPPSAPTPPVPTPPAPDPLAEQHAAEQKAAEQKIAEQKAEAQKAEEQKAEEQKAEEQRKQADAERKAAAEAAAQAKSAEDAKARAEADRKAQQLAQQHKAEQERAQREADLRAQLQAEEHLDAARSNGALALYQAMIKARIERAWIRPPSARSGINCQVHITQVPGGVVTAVQVGACNGDDSVRQSISDAAYRASPLPAPPDPALFDRDLVVTFTPND